MEFIAQLNIENIMASLAMTLIHFFWQAVAIAIALKFVLFVTNKQSLKLRYYSAVTALSACVIIPVFTFSSYYHDASIAASLSGYVNQSGLVETVSLNSVNALASSHDEFWISVIQYVDIRVLVLLWCAGVLTMMVKFVIDLRETYRLTRVGISEVSDDIAMMVSRISQRFGISGSVRVLKSTLVNVPVVIGWLKPTVLIPVAITIGLDRKQLELIIAHELAHVKRLDFLVNLVQGIIQVLFFYHPCIYWINKIVREEREYICDSMALSLLGNQPNTRLDLAKALLNIEELKEGNLSLVAVAASDGHLKNRIGRIVLNDKVRLPSSKGVLVSMFAFIFSFAAIAVTSDFTGNKQTYLQVENLNSTGVSNNAETADQVTRKSITAEDKVVEALAEPLNPAQQSVEAEIVTDLVPVYSNTSKKTDTSLDITTVDPQTKDSNSAMGEFQKESSQNSLLQITPKPTSKLMAAVDKQVKKPKVKAPQAVQAQVKQPNLTSQKGTDSVQRSIEVSSRPTKVALLDVKRVDEIREPRAIITPYPIYPANAYSSRLSGKVKVDFTIDVDGKVIEPEFADGTSWLFVKEIKSKFADWRYEPAMLNGKKIAYQSSIYFDFELPNEEPLVRYQVGTRIKRKIR